MSEINSCEVYQAESESVSRLLVSWSNRALLTKEIFASNSVVAAWDNSTRGLDASTALDYAKSLRLLTDIMQQTTFVSLYQAGEGIYKIVDKVSFASTFKSHLADTLGSRLG